MRKLSAIHLIALGLMATAATPAPAAVGAFPYIPSLWPAKNAFGPVPATVGSKGTAPAPDSGNAPAGKNR